jgi:hypothetical protein
LRQRLLKHKQYEYMERISLSDMLRYVK